MIDKKLLLITALLLASCTSDPMTDATDGGSQIPATSHKIVNTSIDAEAGSLLVYFDDRSRRQDTVGRYPRGYRLRR